MQPFTTFVSTAKPRRSTRTCRRQSGRRLHPLIAQLTSVLLNSNMAEIDDCMKADEGPCIKFFYCNFVQNDNPENFHIRGL